MIIESCHELVPPEEIKPIIEKIITNFITEYCNNKHITIGLNSIREILLRMPLALDEAQIEYLVNFRTFRNSSVVSAAKSLINYFRDVCPQLLPKKFRGRFTNEDGDNKKEDMFFGKQKLNYDVDGIDLLARHEGYDNVESLTTTRVLNDEDFRKIKILKMREALKHVTKDDPFKKKEEEASDPEDDSDVDDDDEGSESEVEFVSDEEEGEIELDEEGEIELDDEDGEEELEEESKASDSSSEITEYEDMDVDSSDLENSSEEDNPHGFVYARTLDTFKKTKKEKIEQQQKDKEDNRDSHKDQFKKRDKKNGGKTNKMNLKNKPFSMVKPKKLESI